MFCKSLVVLLFCTLFFGSGCSRASAAEEEISESQDPGSAQTTIPRTQYAALQAEHLDGADVQEQNSQAGSDSQSTLQASSLTSGQTAGQVSGQISSDAVHEVAGKIGVITDRMQNIEDKIVRIFRFMKDESELIEENDSSFTQTCCLFGILFIIYTISCVRKRIESQNRLIDDQNRLIDRLMLKNQSYNEDILNKLELYSSAPAQPGQGSGKFRIEDQHVIVKSVANKLSFMEVTLSKMDDSIRGHKQLTKSINQMKDTMKAYGYEFVDMIGKPYNPGMKVLANFIEDPQIPQGQQIITGVTKPQINYQGMMIQSAQITVSQNTGEV